MGRMWLHGTRLMPDLQGHLDAVMFVGGRIAFLSDHEGVGNVYSCLPDSTDLRRHTDHADFYARHASTDGSRIVYQCAGDIWLIDDLSPDAVPRKLAVRLGGPRTGRRTYQVPAASHVTSLAVDSTGRASAVGVRGSLYWLTHRDGPARTIHDIPGRPGPAARNARLHRPDRVRHRRRGRRRHRDRQPAPGQRRRASRAGWPPGSSAGSTRWSPRRTANGWRWPRTTAGCCWWTWPGRRRTASASRAPRQPRRAGGDAARADTGAYRRPAPGPATWPS